MIAFATASPLAHPLAARPVRLAPRRPARSTPALTAAPSSKQAISSAPAAPDQALLPPRVVLTPLPTVLVHDHCPVCMRVRFVLGSKNVKHNIVWLMYEDFDTPALLASRAGPAAAAAAAASNMRAVREGRVPILLPDGPEGKAVTQSETIMQFVDSDPRFGAPGLILPSSGRKDLDALMDELTGPSRRLTRPRVMQMPSIQEFTFADGRAIYEERHPLVDPDGFEENIARTDEWMATVDKILKGIESLVYSERFASQGGLSMDDVVLFPKMRALTCVKGLVLPPKLRDYVDFHSVQAEMPLYDQFAV